LRDSISKTESPSSADQHAAEIPAGPPPTIITSKSFIVFCGLVFAIRLAREVLFLPRLPKNSVFLSLAYTFCHISASVFCQFNCVI
jgi:hypothetical protein